MVRPILGAVTKLFDKIKNIDILDTNLSHFGTSVMDPCLITRCRSDVNRTVYCKFVVRGCLVR